jgi:hypothetical protein
LAITRLGRIVIGRWQLTAAGLLREPAQLDDARRDKYVPRSVARRSGQAFLALGWSFGEALTWGARRHSNAYEFARLDFFRRDPVLQSLPFSAKTITTGRLFRNDRR